MEAATNHTCPCPPGCLVVSVQLLANWTVVHRSSTTPTVPPPDCDVEETPLGLVPPNMRLSAEDPTTRIETMTLMDQTILDSGPCTRLRSGADRRQLGARGLADPAGGHAAAGQF